MTNPMFPILYKRAEPRFAGASAGAGAGAGGSATAPANPFGTNPLSPPSAMGTPMARPAPQNPIPALMTRMPPTPPPSPTPAPATALSPVSPTSPAVGPQPGTGAAVQPPPGNSTDLATQGFNHILGRQPSGAPPAGPQPGAGAAPPQPGFDFLDFVTGGVAGAGNAIKGGVDAVASTLSPGGQPPPGAGGVAATVGAGAGGNPFSALMTGVTQRLSQVPPEAIPQITQGAGKAVEGVIRQAGPDKVRALAEIAAGRGQLPPEIKQRGLQALRDGGYDTQTAGQILGGMGTGEQLLMGLGLGMGAIGLISALTGSSGGVMPWLMSILGLGTAGVIAGNRGLLGQGAQGMAQGVMGAIGMPQTVTKPVAGGPDPTRGASTAGRGRDPMIGAVNYIAQNHPGALPGLMQFMPERYHGPLDAHTGVGGIGNRLQSMFSNLTGRGDAQMQEAGLDQHARTAITNAWPQYRQQQRPAPLP